MTTLRPLLTALTFAATFTTLSTARADSSSESIGRTVPAGRAYVGTGLAIATETMALLGEVEGGVHLRGPLWVHARTGAGVGGPLFSEEGLAWELLGGPEVRGCAGRHACVSAGVDAGFQVGGYSHRPWGGGEATVVSYRGVIAEPHVSGELGWQRVAFRVTVGGRVFARTAETHDGEPVEAADLAPQAGVLVMAGLVGRL